MIFLKYVLKGKFENFSDAKIIVKLPSIQMKRYLINFYLNMCASYQGFTQKLKYNLCQELQAFTKLYWNEDPMTMTFFLV